MISELWSDLRYRLRSIVRRDNVERELDDELRFHLEREAEKMKRLGVSPEEADRRARLAFGGVDRIKEDSRDARGTRLFEHLVQDSRYAIRGLRSRPGFAAVVIATLALGLGVNAAMFGILDTLLFRAPAYMIDPTSVHRVYVDWTGTDGKRGFQRSVEYARYLDFARWNRSLSNVAAFAYRQMAVGEGENTKGLPVGVVSASYFDFFSAKPVLGRFFTPQEDSVPAGTPVAVLSFGFWQTEYAGRRDVVGSAIKLEQGTYRIIGVAPRGFSGVNDQRSPAAFIPITAFANARNPDYYRDYNWSWMEVLVRRKAGVSIDAANADLTNAFLRSWNAQRTFEPRLPAAEVVRPEAIVGPVLLARGPLAGPETRVVAWIGGVALVVLLIATANVANLLLARGLRRRREMAVRRAIGGTRGRLIQQILTETLVLAMLATVAGLFGAQLAAGALKKLLVGSTDPSAVMTDGRTLAFTIVVTFITALLAGLLPALHVGRGDLAGSLKAGTRDAAYRHSRVRTTLLVFQTALSVVLLVGAGLFVRSLQEVRSMRIGYDVDRVVYVEGHLRGVRLSEAEGPALANRLLTEAVALPGVEKASLTVSVPFYSSEGRGLRVPGIDSVRKLGRFTLQAGTTDYFATLGTRILRGRGFSVEDRANAPYVAVVSEAMANVLWPNQDAIGKCFHIIGRRVNPCTTVVGIAENIKTRQIAGAPEFMYYLPFEQYMAELGEPPMLALFVRVHGRADDYVRTLRGTLQRVMPGPAYVNVMAMHELVDPTMRSWTSGAKMFLAFGMLALSLAAIGLYAVIAFAVVQRTQELGVRIALGARARDVLRLIVGEGLRVTLAGVVVGGAIALFAGRWIDTLLFRVSARDPLVYTLVVTTLIGVGILASIIPASRAAHGDPNVALRAE